MLFSFPDRTLEAFSPQAISASATLAKYFMPIHLLVVLLEALETRNAYLAQTKWSGRVEARRIDEEAMLAAGLVLRPHETRKNDE
jgi:hypothetical protein